MESSTNQKIKNSILSANVELLKSLLGKKIIKVSRQILINDMDLENFEQMADGVTEFIFDDNRVIHFFSITEIESVGIANTHMPKYGEGYIFRDITNNLFWKQRVKQEITNLTILKSLYPSVTNPSEFGLEFEFKNNTNICIEYLNEEDVFDTIRVIEKLEGVPCERINLSDIV